MVVHKLHYILAPHIAKSLHSIFIDIFLHRSQWPKNTDVRAAQVSSDEIPRTKRLDLAVTAWKHAHGTLSIRKAAKQYGVAFSTLKVLIDGSKEIPKCSHAKQRLTAEEEKALVAWIKRLEACGWPPRVGHLRLMAMKLLKDKGDSTDLGRT